MNPAFPAIRRNLKENPMARRCELTGKGTLVGNNVSHANNKTKRIYRPNLQTIDLVSEALGNSYKLKIAMNTLRTVDKVGGLDSFLLKAKDSVLSAKALRLKRAIAKKTSTKAAA
jgi:large subunit ribosomal protein L28